MIGFYALANAQQTIRTDLDTELEGEPITDLSSLTADTY